MTTEGVKMPPQITPRGWIFWTMIFYNLKKFRSRSIKWGVKLYFELVMELLLTNIRICWQTQYSYVLTVFLSISFNQLPWAESVKLPHMYFHVIYSCECSRFMKSQFFTFIAFEFRSFFPVFFLDVTFQPTFLVASPIAYL